MIKRIEALIQEQVAPALAAHGGSVEVIDVENDKLYIRLSGGCQGCSSSLTTVKEGIATFAQIADGDAGFFNDYVRASYFDATSTTGYLLNGTTLATGSTTLNNYYFAGATTSASNLGTDNLAFGAGAMYNATNSAFDDV